MRSYADQGGRVFASHWHNIWIAGTGDPSRAPPVWPSIAKWNLEAGQKQPAPLVIDEQSNPKGNAFASWMMGVKGSTVRDKVDVEAQALGGTAVSLDMTKGERWLYAPNAAAPPVNFQFTTPNEVAPEKRCGKVAFSDMHVSSDSTSSGDFPNGCKGTELTPQEKTLAFMFFDIASCVDVVE